MMRKPTFAKREVEEAREPKRLSLESTHEAKTTAINQATGVGSETDKWGDKRF